MWQQILQWFFKFVYRELCHIFFIHSQSLPPQNKAAAVDIAYITSAQQWPSVCGSSSGTTEAVSKLLAAGRRRPGQNTTPRIRALRLTWNWLDLRWINQWRSLFTIATAIYIIVYRMPLAYPSELKSIPIQSWPLEYASAPEHHASATNLHNL